MQPTLSSRALPNSLANQVCPPREISPAPSQLRPHLMQGLNSDAPEKPQSRLATTRDTKAESWLNSEFCLKILLQSNSPARRTRIAQELGNVGGTRQNFFLSVHLWWFFFFSHTSHTPYTQQLRCVLGLDWGKRVCRNGLTPSALQAEWPSAHCLLGMMYEVGSSLIWAQVCRE